MSFDLQGNFLLDASRQRLRDSNGPWNTEHFHRVPELVISMLEWAKTRSSNNRADWCAYYELIPDWQRFSEELNLVDPLQEDDQTHGTDNGANSLEERFEEFLAARELLPAAHESGKLTFAGPARAVQVEGDLETVFEPSDLAKVSGTLPVWEQLSAEAKQKLSPYLSRFGARELKERLEVEGWHQRVAQIGSSPGSRRGRSQFAKLLAYLERHWAECRGDQKNAGWASGTDQPASTSSWVADVVIDRNDDDF